MQGSSNIASWYRRTIIVSEFQYMTVSDIETRLRLTNNESGEQSVSQSVV